MIGGRDGRGRQKGTGKERGSTTLADTRSARVHVQAEAEEIFERKFESSNSKEREQKRERARRELRSKAPEERQ